MPWTLPTFADFRARFARDFQFSVDGSDLTKVGPADYANAQADADTQINQDLFSSQADFSTAYLYLTAHYLVMNIKNSTAGLAGAGSSPFAVASKSAGPVSVSYSIPQDILANPAYSVFALSTYGLRYLSLIVPYLAGNVGAVAGWTLP